MRDDNAETSTIVIHDGAAEETPSPIFNTPECTRIYERGSL